jgi:hypothetical protein
MILIATPSAGAYVCITDGFVDHKCLEISNVTISDVYKQDSPDTHLLFNVTTFHGADSIQGKISVEICGINKIYKISQTTNNVYDLTLNCAALAPGNYTGVISVTEKPGSHPEENRTITESFSFKVFAGSATPIDPITIEDLTDPNHGQPGTQLRIIHRATNTGDTNITLKPAVILITDSEGEMVDAGYQSSFLNSSMVVPAHGSVDFITTVSIPRGTPAGELSIEITYFQLIRRL